jgi:hypothetical protein
MLAKILLGVAGLLVLIAGVAATRPSAYRVERKLEIAAPAEVVFALLSDLRQFAGVWVLFGTPFGENDSGLERTFEGPASGAGQSLAWRGKEAGQGKLTVEESVAGERVRLKQVFVKPMASTADVVLTLAGTPAGSLVTWSMAGDHNFIGKVFGLFLDMDKMLGADLEKGLVRVKSAAEGKQGSASAR